jgi:hypothetical protein
VRSFIAARSSSVSPSNLAGFLSAIATYLLAPNAS